MACSHSFCLASADAVFSPALAESLAASLVASTEGASSSVFWRLSVRRVTRFSRSAEKLPAAAEGGEGSGKGQRPGMDSVTVEDAHLSIVESDSICFFVASYWALPSLAESLPSLPSLAPAWESVRLRRLASAGEKPLTVLTTLSESTRLAAPSSLPWPTSASERTWRTSCSVSILPPLEATHDSIWSAGMPAFLATSLTCLMILSRSSESAAK